MMPESFDLALKVALVVFMAGNLLDMGLRLDPRAALGGLRDTRFVIYTLLWGFVLSPALAVGVSLLIPLDRAYAIGLILMGLAPCAPFLPPIVDKAKGDLGYTAALMLLTAVGTVVVMPFALPLLVQGLSVTSWQIARPLLAIILLPLVIGMLTRHWSATGAAKVQPAVKKITGVATLATAVLLLVVYGEALFDVPGNLAVAALLLYFVVLAVLSYWFAFGLDYPKRIVLSTGMTTRNLGAAIAPLFATGGTDQQAMIMVVLGLPIMVAAALLAARWFGRGRQGGAVTHGG
ncbi:hypothetical protein G3480_18980 [Thiorhodococcus mannitoliphagus]|uniref:Bile acid:sodium symporter family protein n=1 Tax=Thiorhodococcus mannitoliphagus TaxID=329406 RepID=A0A6P1E2W8_9GAMM|nr:bile acid:sodium symporter [Thiorhodococcus mannitoliphagus]NEX22364.1 hypothetical protein [Thiorhodococcus mannitoliphagus]